MPWCPVCRDEFRPGISLCPDHGVALVEDLPPEAAETGREAQPVGQAELGVFDLFSVPILIDVLAEHGIDAHSEATSPGPYRNIDAHHALVFAARDRIDEARRIARDELPERLRSLEAEVEADAAFVDDAPAASDGSDAQEAEEYEEYEAVPIGWMEPAVARAFLELCEQNDIGADTEYPLDEPAPPWARADGRVRVHVEDILVAEAMDLLADALPARLAAAGIPAADPVLEPED